MAGETKLQNYNKTVALAVTVLLLILAFMIVRPFVIAVLSAAVLGYLFYPVYLYLSKNQQSGLYKTFGALSTSLIVLCLVLLPFIVISVLLVTEMKSGYAVLKQMLNPDFAPFNFLPSSIAALIPDIGLKEIIADQSGQIVTILQTVAIKAPIAFVNILVTLFLTYYFLKASDQVDAFMHEYFPLPEGKYKKIKARLEDIFRGVVVGQVAVAIIQGLLAWIAFYFLGVPHAFLWSFMTIIISSIPMLGAAMIWIPIDIYLAVIGQQTGNYLPAIILFLYGWFFISTIDNFLRPKIMGDNAKVHPVLFLLGILGGIPLFGVAGILIGPAVLALSTIAIEIYRESF